MTKYHNKIRECRQGHRHRSVAEARRCGELTLMEKGHAISHLQQQPVFELQPSFTYRGEKIRAIKYLADFSYQDGDKWIVEDQKGMRTPGYLMKVKMLKYIMRDREDWEFREIR